MHRVFVATWLLVVLCCTVAWGQPAPDTKARAAEIAPFINEGTILVVHVDLAKLDLAAAEKFVLDTVKVLEVDPKDLEEAIKETRQGLEQARAWLAELRKAGATQVYFTRSMSMEDPVAFIFPVAAGTDEPVLQKAVVKVASEIVPGDPNDPAGGPQAGRVHNAVVLAGEEVLGELKEFKAAPRPDLEQALSAAGDSAAQVVFMPSAELLKVMEAQAGPLPEELGGGPSTLVTQGLKWIVFSAKLPPEPVLTAIVQSPSEEGAKGLHGVIVTGIKSAAIEMLAKRMPELLTPKLEGSRITLTLSGKELDTLVVDVMGPALGKARERARRIQSASNIRQLLMGGLIYANDHKGEWPETLDVLVKESDIPVQVTTNPRRPRANPAYIYIRPPKDAPADRLVIYEAHEAFGEGINIGYGDGHVEWVADEARFKKELEAAKGK